MVGFFLRNTGAALGMFGVELRSIGTHLAESCFILDRITLLRCDLAFTLFIAPLFTNKVEAHGATAKAELMNNGFF